jgi:hypothetical protein
MPPLIVLLPLTIPSTSKSPAFKLAAAQLQAAASVAVLDTEAVRRPIAE